MNNNSATRAIDVHAPGVSTTRYAFLFSPAWMVMAGLVIRLGSIVALHLYRFDVSNWTKFEMARIAHSLAVGQGFSAPWGGSTGPSAWTAPLYPWLVSLVFRVFGVYSNSAAFVLLTLNSVFSAATSWTIFHIASRVFNLKAAAWAGWIWALFPAAIVWSTTWIWETSLSAFLLSVVFLLTLRMAGEDGLWAWIRYGLLWGIAALTNPALTSWLPFAGCWLAYQLYQKRKRFVAPVLVGAALFWVVVTPWIVRDYVAFHKLMFIRDDVGCELRAGNNSDANGYWNPAYQAANNPVLFAQYKEMGEASFDREQARLAKEWIAENPGRFLALCRIRVFHFWFVINEPQLFRARQLFLICLTPLSLAGLVLALRRRVNAAFLFASLIIFFPLIYYITFPTDRYHHAIEPELVILAVYCIASEPEPKPHAEIVKSGN
jgi:4-amino-4-deoxy-L-arabinose transferase-like glycosyltransferase